jgi:hypothetical protein
MGQIKMIHISSTELYPAGAIFYFGKLIESRRKLVVYVIQQR